MNDPVVETDDQAVSAENPEDRGRRPAAPVGPQAHAPKWVLIAAYVTGVIVLLFLMGFGALATLGVLDACAIDSARFFLVGVVAFGVGLSSSFLGGHAAAEGRIAIPFAREHPLAFSVGGGVAVFIVTFLIANSVFPDRNPDCAPSDYDVLAKHRLNVGSLQSMWHGRGQYPNYVEEVAKRSGVVAATLLDVPRRDLRPTQDVDRALFASMAYVHGGLALEDMFISGQRRSLEGLGTVGERATIFADSATMLLDEIMRRSQSGGRDAPSYRAALQELRETKRPELAAYYGLLGRALVARADPTPARIEQLIDQIPEVGTEFLLETSPCREPLITRLCEHQPIRETKLCICE